MDVMTTILVERMGPASLICNPETKQIFDTISQSEPRLALQVDILFCYFGIRKFATHWVSLGFFCMLVPLSTFTPEVSIPLWALVHLPVVVTLSTAVFTPNGWVHSILYVLFENAMGIVKLGAVIAGEYPCSAVFPCSSLPPPPPTHAHAHAVYAIK